MSTQAFSYRGRTISISTTVQNSDLNQVGFEGLTYTAIGGVGSVGEYGVITNPISYDTLADIISLKAKGITDAGAPDVEMARDDTDAGQSAMRAAGAANVYDNYAFKVTNQDGSIDYLRGLVMGPRSPGGRNEDFDLHLYSIGLNQSPLHDDASV